MLAFIRGGDRFMSADQIYVKMLPEGETPRVTDDKRIKYGLAFSPTGSEIAYTVLKFQLRHLYGFRSGWRLSSVPEKCRRGSPGAARTRSSSLVSIPESISVS